MRRALPLLALLVGCPKTETIVTSAVELPPVSTLPTDATPLPFDADVHHGVLDNGLRWFIDVNDEPADRAVLRLAFEAGSVLEDEDQLGLAHFVEHMAFNGTEHYPGNELITYLEGVGSSFGAHLNAHTSFDETVYKLMVPTDDEAVYNEAFQVLDDWACCLTFADEEIEKERGVVLEEWRLRQGASDRISKQTVPLIFHNSMYAERLPIGTEASLKTFEPDAARRFFNDWYRPDLAAVIVVGNVDPEKTQALIEQHFADWKAPENPRERTRFTIPPHDETLSVVVTDPEVTRTTVSVGRSYDNVEEGTHESYRAVFAKNLALAMLNERFTELARDPETPFMGAGASDGRMSPNLSQSTVGAAAKPGKAVESLEAMWTELERAKRHGFQPGELDRAKAKSLQFYNSLLAEVDNLSSVDRANELVRHVTTSEPVPGISYEVKMAQAWMPDVTLEEVNAWMKTWMPADTRLATVILPEQEGVEPPTKESLIEVIASVEASTDIEPPAAEEAVAELLSSLPEPGTITSTDNQFTDTLGFTGWTLSNGVQVWFKTTDFKDNELEMDGWAPGGTSVVADDDYVALALADDWVHSSGFGALDSTGIQRWMAGKTVSLSHGAGSEYDAVSGSSSPADLEPMLQLLWASFAAPRFDDNAREVLFANNITSRENRLQDPGAQFADADDKVMWPQSPRWQSWTVDDVKAANDPAKLEALYREHFTDASGYSFVFTGALPSNFEELVLRYIASLPKTDRERTIEALDVKPNLGPHDLVVTAGTAPKSQVKLQWITPFDDQTWVTRNRQQALRDVLSVMLREKLREDLGGVYGVSVGASAWRTPVQMSAITVSFTCDPERVDELVAATQAVIDEVVKAPVEQRLVAQEQEKGRRSREESRRTNSFWGGGLAGALQRGEDPNDILTWDERNNSLTPELVQEAAGKYLSATPQLKVVLKPEADSAEAE